MNILLRAVNSTLEGYRVFNEDWSYPRTKDFFMCQSPFPIITLAGFYLLFSKKIGPAFMRNRKPYNITKIIIAYNILQIAMNLYMNTMAIYMAKNFSIFCQEIEQRETPEAISISWLVWLYYMNKIMDLLDTVFFIMKKKSSHVSFLHMYHHCGMLFLGYVGTKYVPGGHSMYVGIINSFVHIIMYSYYLLTLIKKDKTDAIWWKKHLTQLQLVQFLILFLVYSSSLLLPDCKFPRFVSFMMVSQNMFLFLLFGDFYKKNYLTHPKKQ